MELKQALRAVRRYGASLVNNPATRVRFIAVGNKDTGPLDEASEFSVTAYVENKLTEQQLKSRGLEPFTAAFASVVGKRPGRRDIDVVETTGVVAPMPSFSVATPERGRYGGRPAVVDSQKHFRSLRTGIGVTNPEGYPDSLSVGTAGFYMEDADGNLYLVSNNHVIGRSNAAVPGESVTQPGTLDLTDRELDRMATTDDLLAELEIAQLTATVPLRFPDANGTPNNRVDASIAALLDVGRGLDDLDRVCFGGAIQGVAAPYSIDGTTGALRQSSRVYKCGRTTGYTEGDVVGIDGVANVEYEGGVATFVDQIVVQATPDNGGPFSDSGDSGSGVLNDEHKLVGLLYAGNERHTFLNPIRDVINELRDASGIDSLEVISS